MPRDVAPLQVSVGADTRVIDADIISATRAKFPHMTDADIDHVLEIIEGARAATPCCMVTGIERMVEASRASEQAFKEACQKIIVLADEMEDDDGPV
jgi:hypothetical protein